MPRHQKGQYIPKHQQVLGERREVARPLVTGGVESAPRVAQRPDSVAPSTSAGPSGIRRVREGISIRELTPGTPAQKQIRHEKSEEIAAEQIRQRAYRRKRGMKATRLG